MKAREVLDTTTTPDGETLQLAQEGGFYVIRVGGIPLMSSAAHGSEEAMAFGAAELLGPRRNKARVLVGGLGMGYTLRATLDAMGPQARVTVAELLPAIVRYNRSILAALARHPLEDTRAELFEGDVRSQFRTGAWDAILMDVDNGPEAFTTVSNASLYGDAGLKRMRAALRTGGVLVIWSAHASPRFEARLKRAGFRCETRRLRARGNKGARHWLFFGHAPT